MLRKALIITALAGLLLSLVAWGVSTQTTLRRSFFFGDAWITLGLTEGRLGWNTTTAATPLRFIPDQHIPMWLPSAILGLAATALLVPGRVKWPRSRFAKALAMVSLTGFGITIAAWAVSYWGFLWFGENTVVEITAGRLIIGEAKMSPHDIVAFEDTCAVNWSSPEAQNDYCDYAARVQSMLDQDRRWLFLDYPSWKTMRPASRLKPALRWRPLHVVVPLWVACAVFALAPAVFILRDVPANRRRRLGLCVQCGYSLHGGVEPRCPECGCATEIPPRTADGPAG